MTAINTLIQNHGVHLITDAAAYDADGNLLAAVPKVTMLAHLNAAIACRGPRSRFRCSLIYLAQPHQLSMT